MSAGACDDSATGQSGQNGDGQTNGNSSNGEGSQPASGGGQSGSGRGLGDGSKPGDELYVSPRIIEENGAFQMSQYGETDEVRIEMLTTDSETGQKMDYKELVALYEKQALRALEEESIPAGMESVVKEYFVKINE